MPRGLQCKCTPLLYVLLNMKCENRTLALGLNKCRSVWKQGPVSEDARNVSTYKKIPRELAQRPFIILYTLLGVFLLFITLWATLAHNHFIFHSQMIQLWLIRIARVTPHSLYRLAVPLQRAIAFTDFLGGWRAWRAAANPRALSPLLPSQRN